MQRHYGWFRDSEGRGYPGAQVTVLFAGTSTKADLFLAGGLVGAPAPQSNPFLTDPNGFYAFAVANGTYDLTLEGSGTPTTYIQNLTIGTADITAIQASAVSFTPAGGISATNSQSAITELDSEALHKAGIETITGVKTFSAQPSGIAASSIVNTPSGGIASTDVQAAINELDTDKVAANVAITPATKTKITYDAKGLVTVGADAVTNDITESTGRLFVKDGTFENIVVSGNGLVWRDPLPVAQCRLDFVSASVVRLNRFNGRFLTINGVRYEIPSAGVDLSSTGLSTTTLLYVYAYMSGATMTLEASTTAWAVDATTGFRIKNGDASRTFLGWVYLRSANTFESSNASRLVISWFNPKRLSILKKSTAARSTASTSPVETNSEMRAYFISRGDDIDVSISSWGGVSANTATGSTYAALDATTYHGDGIRTNLATGTGNCGVASTANLTPSEGFHTMTTYFDSTNAGVTFTVQIAQILSFMVVG